MYNGLASWADRNTSGCHSSCPYPAWPTPPAKENASYTESIQQGCTAPNQFTHTIKISHAAHGTSTGEAVLTGITLGCGGSFTPYVRHTTSTDDGVALVQTTGSIIQDDGTYNGGINTPAKTSGGGGLTDYKRPTTIAIQGANTFSEFKITDIRWWYKTFNVQTIDRNRMRYDMKTAQREWQQGCGGGDCESFRAVVAAYVRQRSTHMQWSEGTHQGSTFLDAAIQLVGGANVCLTGSITDATSAPGSAGGGGTTGATDAMIVYPTTGHNFMLRVNGDYRADALKGLSVYFCSR